MDNGPRVVSTCTCGCTCLCTHMYAITVVYLNTPDYTYYTYKWYCIWFVYMTADTDLYKAINWWHVELYANIFALRLLLLLYLYGFNVVNVEIQGRWPCCFQIYSLTRGVTNCFTRAHRRNLWPWFVLQHCGLPRARMLFWKCLQIWTRYICYLCVHILGTACQRCEFIDIYVHTYMHIYMHMYVYIHIVCPANGGVSGGVFESVSASVSA